MEQKTLFTVVELIPLASQNQISFYGKAKILRFEENDKEILQSYDTYIMEKVNGVFRRLCDTSKASTTTLKHIKAFSGMNKKQFCELSTEV